MMRRTALVAFLIALTLAWVRGSDGSQESETEPAPEVPALAIRLGHDSPLRAKLVEDRTIRGLENGDYGSMSFEMGPAATGALVVEPYLLPLSPETRARLADLPVTIDAEGIMLAGTRYGHPDHRLALRLPTAERAHWLVVGRDARSVHNLTIRSLLSGGMRFDDGRAEPIDYLLLEGDGVSRSGRWRTDEAGVSIVDPDHDVDQMAERDAIWASRVEIAGKRIVLRVPKERSKDRRLHDLARDLDAMIERVAPRIPLALEAVSGPDRIVVWVEDHYDSLGRYFGRVEAAVEHAHAVGAGTERRMDLHVIPHPEDDFDLRFAVARLLVRAAGLAEDTPKLRDGAALWLTRDWYGRTFDAWLPLLAFGRVLPTVAELRAAEEPRDTSRVLWAPSAAGVIDRLSGDTLRDRLGDAEDVDVGDSALEAALVGLRALAARAPDPTAPRPWDVPFLRGVSLTRAIGAGNGYESPGYEKVLDHLETMGVDAISLVPMTGHPRPNEPVFRFMNRSPGDEHDIGMLAGARAARARGFSVLWKPHIYVSGGSWPGDIVMTTEADWRRWWTGYRHFMLYQAILATHARADLFSVGTELGKTLEREAEWRHLIDSVRRLFPGRVTYAGNWWEDYDRIPFADRLDAVGVDAYFTLSHDADATDEELVQGAHAAMAEMAAASKRFGKPILLTEVGFSARKAAWISPHEEGDWQDPDVLSVFSTEDQRRGYAALLGTLGQPEWLAGLYPWKVFSGGVPEGPGRAPDFGFLGRPAEKVVSDYYRGLATATPRTATPR